MGPGQPGVLDSQAPSGKSSLSREGRLRCRGAAAGRVAPWANTVTGFGRWGGLPDFSGADGTPEQQGTKQ